MKPLLYPLLFTALTSACSAGPSKTELDAEVRRLCAVDGGVKVYETAVLPPEMYNEQGVFQGRIPMKERVMPSDKYHYEVRSQVLVKGNPRLIRTEVQIVRKADGKVLGTKVSYGRGGGDWAPSSFTCPDPTASVGLESSVFVNGGRP